MSELLAELPSFLGLVASPALEVEDLAASVVILAIYAKLVSHRWPPSTASVAFSAAALAHPSATRFPSPPGWAGVQRVVTEFPQLIRGRVTNSSNGSFWGDRVCSGVALDLVVEPSFMSAAMGSVAAF